MRHLFPATLLAALALSPLAAETVHPERMMLLNCAFDRSCSAGGCDGEDYHAAVAIEGARAVFRDSNVRLEMTGGFDPASGQMSFASEPSDDASYFFSDFGSSGALLSIHAWAEDRAIAIAFEGHCEEVN